MTYDGTGAHTDTESWRRTNKPPAVGDSLEVAATQSYGRNV